MREPFELSQLSNQAIDILGKHLPGTPFGAALRQELLRREALARGESYSGVHLLVITVCEQEEAMSAYRALADSLAAKLPHLEALDPPSAALVRELLGFVTYLVEAAQGSIAEPAADSGSSPGPKWIV